MDDQPRLALYNLLMRAVVLVALLTLLGPAALPTWVERAGRSAAAATLRADYAAAEGYLQAVIALRPWDQAALFYAAQQADQAGAPERAVQYYLRAEQAAPLPPQRAAELGALEAALGRADEAAIRWEQAAAGGFFSPELTVNLAQGYIERGQWGQAEALYQALTRYEGTNAVNFYRLGLLQALRASDDAQSTLAQAVALDAAYAVRLAPLQNDLARIAGEPQADLAAVRLGTHYLRLEEYHLAEETFQRAVWSNPAYGEALAYLALSRARLGKPSLAAAQQAIALDPDSAVIYYLVGQTWDSHSRPAEARALFERGHDLDPANPAFAVEIAETHRAEGRLEYAEIWFQEAARLAPGDVQFRLLLARFYADERYKLTEAGLPLAQALAAEQPESPAAREVLGWALYHAGEAEAGIAELETALALDAGTPRAHFYLGEIYEARQQRAQAIYHFEQAARLAPSGAVGLAAQQALSAMGER